MNFTRFALLSALKITGASSELHDYCLDCYDDGLGEGSENAYEFIEGAKQVLEDIKNEA